MSTETVLISIVTVLLVIPFFILELISMLRQRKVRKLKKKGDLLMEVFETKQLLPLDLFILSFTVLILIVAHVLSLLTFSNFNTTAFVVSLFGLGGLGFFINLYQVYLNLNRRIELLQALNDAKTN